jgi:hypothetical protein
MYTTAAKKKCGAHATICRKASQKGSLKQKKLKNNWASIVFFQFQPTKLAEDLHDP